MNRIIFSFLFFTLALYFAACSQEQEKNKTEDASLQAKSLTDEEVKSSVENYVQQNKNDDGYFIIKDEVENRERNLSFGYIHSTVKKDDRERYFVCVDFTEAANDTLDLDFYVNVDSNGKPKVDEAIIHKVNGKSR